jgi:hypothetical protein
MGQCVKFARPAAFDGVTTDTAGRLNSYIRDCRKASNMRPIIIVSVAKQTSPLNKMERQLVLAKESHPSAAQALLWLHAVQYWATDKVHRFYTSTK